MFLRRNRTAAWIATFALALQALWPLLSHARPKDPSLLVPVCTIDGVTHYLEIKSGNTPLDERSSLHGDHCKLCVFGDGKPVAAMSLEVSAFLLVGNASQGTARPAVVFHEPPHLLCVRPRAPPQFS